MGEWDSFGQGWIPWDLSPEEAQQGVAHLGELLEAQGRARGDVRVSVAMEITDRGIDVDAYAQAASTKS